MTDASWRSNKRSKIDQAPEEKSVDISSASQLHDLLYFRQSTSPDVKNGINQFRHFLTNIANEKGKHEQDIRILRQYCDEQTAASNDKVNFPDLIATWSFAAQSNNEPILSAVPAVLAQFLRTISGSLAFTDFGLGLCHTLLKRDQLRLIDRGLSSPKSKEFLISPCLRLLTEITSFDGGALASKVFGKRDLLSKKLETWLNQRQTENGANEDDRRRPSPRRLTLRILLALMKFLDENARTELITTGKLMHLCIQHLEHDGADLVLEILDAIDVHLIETNIPRQAKAQLLFATNLTSLSRLYAFEEGEENPDQQDDKPRKVRQVVHDLLLKACTTKQGILLPQSGWYTPGMNPDANEQDFDSLELGLDSPYHLDDYSVSVPVKNGILSTFIQKLRPEIDILQAALVTATFTNAPELVANYFSKRTTFATSPKDDPMWRGQFAFFFSVVRLPAPRNCGWHDRLPSIPPPLSIVIESILPRPFDLATISRCLTIKDEVMTISAARLMTVALEKLGVVLSIFRSATSNPALWNQACVKLSDMFVSRCPELKDIIVALQQWKDSLEVRASIIECLAMYCQILPSSTTSSKFDVGLILSETISKLSSEALDTRLTNILQSQLLNTLKISKTLPAMRWLHGPDSTTLSPFASMLRYYTTLNTTNSTQEPLSIIKSVLMKKGIVRSEGRSIKAFLASLASTKRWSVESSTWSFIDDCMARIAQKPVRYVEILTNAQTLVSDEKPLSLLACAILEQWPFAFKKNKSSELSNLSEWIAKIHSTLEASEENYRVLLHFQTSMLSQADKKTRSGFEKAIEKLRKKPIVLSEPIEGETSDTSDREFGNSLTQIKSASLEGLFGNSNPQPTSLEGLDRWDRADFDLEVRESGRLSKLILCTSSDEEEVRRQAFQLLKSVIHYVEMSSYSEKQQLYLLLGELHETIKIHGLDHLLPSIVSELATQLLRIISDPSDKMYSKANRFLMNAPSWDLTRVISYWFGKILFSEPEFDDGYMLEMDRLLDLLIHGLRTETDMELYRKSHVFERLLSFYSSQACSRAMRRKIVHILYNAIQVGGSDTLVTRCGIKAWLVIAKRGDDGDIVERLEHDLDKNCTKENIIRWELARPISKSKVELNLGSSKG